MGRIDKVKPYRINFGVQDVRTLGRAYVIHKSIWADWRKSSHIELICPSVLPSDEVTTGNEMQLTGNGLTPL